MFLLEILLDYVFYLFVFLCPFSLGMKDSLGPLKALVAASVVNGFGDILLCCVFNYGIAGAAWATMISQVCHHLIIVLSPCIL